MNETKYVFGTVPSRRLGNSLGISPIPRKTCNFACVYCQLGRTNKMTNEPKEFFPLEDILNEFDTFHSASQNFDIVTIVGEGEPTLYSRLGELITELKKRTDKPVAVITNSALLYDATVRKKLMDADMVLPSLDFCDEETFHSVNRPYGRLDWKEVYEGLVTFSHEYKGRLDLEIMLVKGMNDSDECLATFKKMIERIRYDELSINTPVRPPAEDYVEVVTHETLVKAVELLGGKSIDMLVSGEFSSDIEDDYDAIISIIRRHPMNQFEIRSFLNSREKSRENINNNCNANSDNTANNIMNNVGEEIDEESIFARLDEDEMVERKDYKGYYTYRIRM